MGKRNQGIGHHAIQPLKLGARKRADCVLREVRCTAGHGELRAALEQAVATEIDRMRALQQSEATVRAFKAATDLHLALCDRKSS